VLRLRRALLDGRWDGDAGGVGPKALDVVEGTGVFLEDMEDDVVVVDQHPARRLGALDADGEEVVVVLERLADALGDGAHLTRVATAHHHHVVRVPDELAHIEDDRIERLLVDGEGGDDLRQGA